MYGGCGVDNGKICEICLLSGLNVSEDKNKEFMAVWVFLRVDYCAHLAVGRNTVCFLQTAKKEEGQRRRIRNLKDFIYHMWVNDGTTYSFHFRSSTSFCQVKLEHIKLKYCDMNRDQKFYITLNFSTVKIFSYWVLFSFDAKNIFVWHVSILLLCYGKKLQLI